MVKSIVASTPPLQLASKPLKSELLWDKLKAPGSVIVYVLSILQLLESVISTL